MTSQNGFRHHYINFSSTLWTLLLKKCNFAYQQLSL